MEQELVLDSLMAEGEAAAAATMELPAAGEQGSEHTDGEAADTDGAHEAGEGGDKGQDDSKSDGRKNPDATRKHLASLKANPETAELGKDLTNRLGKVRGYEEVYPTVREAREVKALLDSVGGREQVTAAVESHATMLRVDQLVEAGDPAVLDQMFKQSPAGMVKLVGPMLDQAAKADPAAYAAALKPHAVQMLNGDGVPGALNALVDAFNKDDKAGLQDMIGRLVKYYQGLIEGAKPKQVDPERAKLDEDKSAFAKEKETAAIQETFGANLEYSAKAIDTGLAADVKRLGLGPKAVERLRQDIWRNLETKRNADPGFKKNIQGKFNGKTPKAEAVAYLNSFTNDKVKAAIDEEVVARYGERKAVLKTDKDITAAKKQPGAAAEKQVAAGALRVDKMPSRQEIDWDDPRTKTFDGLAVRKSDKRLITWR